MSPTRAAVPLPHAVTEVAGPSEFGGGDYAYDDAGNQVSRPGQSLVFNEVGKMSSVTEGSVTVTQIYDDAGSILLSASSTGEVSSYLGDVTVARDSADSVVQGFRTYVGPEGKPVAQRSAMVGTSGSTLAWLFTGLQGTVDVRTNAATGATTQQYRDPFGTALEGSALLTGTYGCANRFEIDAGLVEGTFR